MERFSPKIEIINHFDDLIHKVDIDIEEKIEKYNENQLLGELECFKVENRTGNALKFFKIYDYIFEIEFFEFRESSDEIKEQWSESKKVVDYLNQIRMATIEELRKEQKESLENSSRFNSLINAELTKEEKRSELFAEKFYFQVKITRSDIKSWVFNLFTFVTDFYISQSDIDLLEKFIHSQNDNINLTQNHIFDEKMILIGLLYKYFCDNINNQKFPNHVIHVFKNDVSKIEQIYFSLNISAIKLNSSSIDLSKLKRLIIKTATALDYIIIDSLYSLEYLCLEFDSVKEISFKNLNSLKLLSLISKEFINLQTDLFDHLPNIKGLSYYSHFMKFEFKKLEKSIELSRIFNIEDLNLELFMNNFYNEIEKIKISDINIEQTTSFISNYQFPNLLLLSVSSCYITRIEKKPFDLLAEKIQKLDINNNRNLEIIDHDAFSNFKQLVSLDLRYNSIESSLDRRHFSGLINLERLDLGFNRLNQLDENIFSDLKNLKKLSLSQNNLETLEANIFFGLENLKELNLSRNTFEKIDNDVFSNLKHLVSLDLSHNYIESLDRRHFSSLINLERLDLGWNRLKRLDDNIFSDLKNLKMVDLSCNQMEKFDPKSIFGLENLNKLNLSHNKLITIDHDVFSSLKHLVSLDLSHNSIESLDKSNFLGLINLESLDLSSNRLKRIDEEIFSDLKSLKCLYLRRNQLEILDAKLFVGLDNLKSLYLTSNKLKHFDVRILDNLPKLHINLSNNEICKKEMETLNLCTKHYIYIYY